MMGGLLIPLQNMVLTLKERSCTSRLTGSWDAELEIQKFLHRTQQEICGVVVVEDTQV